MMVFGMCTALSLSYVQVFGEEVAEGVLVEGKKRAGNHSPQNM
jgi:hypothetical protein